MLYLIATPIGNLEDITYRAIRIMLSCDYLLCEDTRTSKVLLNFYEIRKPLVSFHKFNEKRQQDSVLQDLANGKTIGLISDAGSPIVSDPGHFLVEKCIEKKLPYTILPGPCSVIAALMLSGLDGSLFEFLGFLEKQKGKRELQLKKMLFSEKSSLCFESPHRLIETLSMLNDLAPNQKIGVAREMTKKFEEFLFKTPNELLSHFSNGVKGEIVLIVPKGHKDHLDFALDELIPLLQKELGVSLKEAIKLAAKLTHKKKSDVYKSVIEKE